MKIRFVKPHFPFFYGEVAIVPDRVGRWFTNAGYAFEMKERETLPPLQPEPEPKPLTKRTFGKKK